MEFLTVQVVNFLLAIATGLFLGILFDVYRGLWKILSPPRATLPLWDLLWWILVTAFVFLVLLWCTWGEVRFYLFLGQLIGFLIYLKKFSAFFLANFIRVVLWLGKTIRQIFHIISIPFKILKKILLWPFVVLGLALYQIMKFFRKLFSFSGKIGRNALRRLGKKFASFFRK